MGELAKKTKFAIIWNALERVCVQGISFVVSIILARILSPSDFGLIGMLTIFISLSTLIIEGGFTKALIQKPDCRDEDYSTAFVSNVVVAILLYLILYFSAPFIADFYKEPVLTKLLRILSLNFVIGSINIVQIAKLMRNMMFRQLAIVNSVGTIVGGVVGIAMAYGGLGVWAIVGQHIAHRFIMVAVFPFFSKWKFSITFSLDSFKSLFGYGSKLLISNGVSIITNNISSVAIGKLYTSQQLGYYTRADQLSNVVASTINDVLVSVSFPVLSEVQKQRERILSIFKKSLFYSVWFFMPISFLLVVLARPLILILLTEKWAPAVVLFQLLCASRIFLPMYSLNMSFMNAVGRSDLYMKTELVKVPFNLLILFITIPLGVYAIAIGTLISSIISVCINSYYIGKLYDYGFLKQIKDICPIIFTTILMSIFVYIIQHLFTSEWLQLIVGGISGVCGYLLCSILMKTVTISDIRMFLNK